MLVSFLALGFLGGCASHAGSTVEKADEAPSKPAPPAGTIQDNAKDGQKYVWIAAGTFLMGCSAGDSKCGDDEKPPHQVEISRGFWMGQTEVTVGAYKRYVRAVEDTRMPEHSEMEPAITELYKGWTNDQLPMNDVSFHDSGLFCEWAQAGGRLPTEAEWEYAARAGNPGALYGEPDQIAWYGDNSGKERINTTALLVASSKVMKASGLSAPNKYMDRVLANVDVPHPVALKKPNGWNLFDMLGNLQERTSDWYDENYYSASGGKDPAGPRVGSTYVGQQRAIRGGAHGSIPAGIRVSIRSWQAGGSNDSIGFRCVSNVP